MNPRLAKKSRESGAHILCLLLLLAASGNASADLIQVTWDGFVRTQNQLPTGLQTGDLASGSFAYDTDSPGSELQGGFWLYDTNLQMDYTVGGIAGSTNDLDFTLFDGMSPTQDQVQIRVDQYFGDAPVSSGAFAGLGGSISGFQFTFQDLDSSALSSTQLPMSFDLSDGWDLSPPGQDISRLFIFWSDGSNVTIEFTDLASENLSVAVPEPGTLGLFGLALAGMGLARRRKQV